MPSPCRRWTPTFSFRPTRWAHGWATERVPARGSHQPIPRSSSTSRPKASRRANPARRSIATICVCPQHKLSKRARVSCAASPSSRGRVRFEPVAVRVVDGRGLSRHPSRSRRVHVAGDRHAVSGSASRAEKLSGHCRDGCAQSASSMRSTSQPSISGLLKCSGVPCSLAYWTPMAQSPTGEPFSSASPTSDWRMMSLN